MPEWLQASMEGKSPGQAFGALIFSCNGRGRNLFGEPHYDSRKIAEFIPVPSSGFLCNGGLSSDISQVLHVTSWCLVVLANQYLCSAVISAASSPA